MFFGSPKHSEEFGGESFNERDSYSNMKPDEDEPDSAKLSMTHKNQSKSNFAPESNSGTNLGKRPYSGVDRPMKRDVSDKSNIGGTSALVSEDRTDPFTESGNFDRDTQDDFVAQEFEKISLGRRKTEQAVIPDTIHDPVISCNVYSETQLNQIKTQLMQNNDDEDTIDFNASI